MHQRDTGGAAERGNRAELVEDVVLGLLRSQRERAAAEADLVRQPGCAPTATPRCAASSTVRRIVPGSPAWNPAATFTVVTNSNIAASSPIDHAPNDSPASTFRSMVALIRA